MDWEIKKGQQWPYGVSVWQNHLNLAFELPEKKKVVRGRQELSCPDEKELEIKIYDLARRTSVTMPVDGHWRCGRAYGVELICKDAEKDKDSEGMRGASIENFGYQVLCDGKAVLMPYAKGKRRIDGNDVYLCRAGV